MIIALVFLPRTPPARAFARQNIAEYGGLKARSLNVCICYFTTRDLGSFVIYNLFHSGLLDFLVEHSHENLIGAFLDPLSIVCQCYMYAQLFQLSDTVDGVLCRRDIRLKGRLHSVGQCEDSNFAFSVKYLPVKRVSSLSNG